MVFTPEIRSGMLLAAVGLDQQLRSLMELEELAAVPTGAWRLWNRSARAHHAWTPPWRTLAWLQVLSQTQVACAYANTQDPVWALRQKVNPPLNGLGIPGEWHVRTILDSFSRTGQQPDRDRNGYINIHLYLKYHKPFGIHIEFYGVPQKSYHIDLEYLCYLK